MPTSIFFFYHPFSFSKPYSLPFLTSKSSFSSFYYFLFTCILFEFLLSLSFRTLRSYLPFTPTCLLLYTFPDPPSLINLYHVTLTSISFFSISSSFSTHPLAYSFPFLTSCLSFFYSSFYSYLFASILLFETFSSPLFLPFFNSHSRLPFLPPFILFICVHPPFRHHLYDPTLFGLPHFIFIYIFYSLFYSFLLFFLPSSFSKPSLTYSSPFFTSHFYLSFHSSFYAFILSFFIFFSLFFILFNFLLPSSFSKPYSFAHPLSYLPFIFPTCYSLHTLSRSPFSCSPLPHHHVNLNFSFFTSILGFTPGTMLHCAPQTADV